MTRYVIAGLLLMMALVSSIAFFRPLNDTWTKRNIVWFLTHLGLGVLSIRLVIGAIHE